MQAAYDGEISACRRIIASDPDAAGYVNASGFSSLIWAAYQGHEDVVDLLLPVTPISVLNPAPGLHTAIRAAANKGRLSIVKKLIAAGADVNIPSDGDKTALMGASMFGHADICKLLLEAGADSSLSIANSFGETALDLAKTDRIKDLIQRSATAGNAAANIPPVATQPTIPRAWGKVSPSSAAGDSSDVVNLSDVMREEQVCADAIRAARLEEERLGLQMAAELHDQLQLELCAEAALAEAEAEEWSCQVCTFLNAPLSLVCEMCRSEKPSAHATASEKPAVASTAVAAAASADTEGGDDAEAENPHDSDFALAQALQAQEEEDAWLRQHERQRQLEREQGTSSKVRLAFASSVRPAHFASTTGHIPDCTYDSPAKRYQGVSQNPATTRARARGCEPTKHDALAAAVRNVERMEHSRHDAALYRVSGDINDQMRNKPSSQSAVVLPDKVFSKLKSHYAKQKKKGVAQHGGGSRNSGGRSNRATEDKVLDTGTRLALFRYINTGLLSEVRGAIRTGKEASVFHAVGHHATCGGSVSDSGSAAGGAGTMKYPLGTASPSDVEESGLEVEDRASPASTGDTAIHYACKIFKTSLKDFSNRAEYVEGDHRFRATKFSSQKNARKLCKIWCEKEFKNLVRIHSAGIRCPRPVETTQHILLMRLVPAREGQGNAAKPAPQLRDAVRMMQLSSRRLRSLYRQCAVMMRALYQRCRLIHADLSEFNLLYQRGYDSTRRDRLFLIDVGQSVDFQHPRARFFLRRDVKQVTNFFAKALADRQAGDDQGDRANVLSYCQLYSFIEEKDLAAFREIPDGVSDQSDGGRGEGSGEKDKMKDQLASEALILKKFLTRNPPVTDLTEGGRWQCQVGDGKA